MVHDVAGLDLSPFLKIGTMLAFLQFLGTVPSSNDVWNILAIAGVMTLAKLFSNFGEMVSDPAALWTFKFCNSFKTPFSITLISGSFGMVFLPTSGKLVRYSCVYPDLNCALSISALLLLALCNIPSFPLGGARPEFSCFLAFMKGPKSLGVKWHYIC